MFCCCLALLHHSEILGFVKLWSDKFFVLFLKWANILTDRGQKGSCIAQTWSI